MPPVLIVEDDDDVRNSMSYLLELEGYSVLRAENGRRALDVLAQGDRPCLILLDLLMPVMDGVEFLSELRRRPQLGAIPVYILSAASTVEPPPQVPRLWKPVSVDQLLDIVRTYCQPKTAVA